MNITSLAQGWAKGTYASNGILIKAKTESSSKKNFSSFYNAYYGTASKRPVLSVTYTVPSPSVPAKPTSVLLNNKSPLYARKTDTVKIKWVGAKSNILKNTQWRLVKYTAANTYDTATVIQEYTNTGVNAASGTFTIPAGKMNALSDGKYCVLIRGVDKMDKKGTGKGCFMYIDGTAPTLSGVQMDQTSTPENPSSSLTPTISWTASDAIGLASVSVMLDGTAVFTTAQSGACSYTFDEEDFAGTANHQIVVIAKDKAGNSRSSGTLTYYTNLDSPIISNVAIDIETSATDFSNNSQPTVSFSVEADNLEKCEVSLGENVIYSSEQAGSHTVQVPANASMADGHNDIIITATSNTGISSTRTVRFYYDGTAPVFNTLSTTPDTGIFNRSANPSPQINWDISDIMFSSVSFSIDGETFTEMGTDPVGSFILPADTFDRSGRYVLHIRAEDSAGNTEEQDLVYYLSLGNETDQDYVPEITDVQENYGKRVIRYSANIDDYTTAYWNLYRKDVSEGEQGGNNNESEVLIQGHLTGTMFIDNEIIPKGDYEYRMEAVFTDTSKGTISGNTYSYSHEVPETAFINATGSKSYLGKFDFATPNGSGQVEASSGVLTYSQQDYELTNDKLSYGMIRTYSSGSGMRGMLGNGWLDSYHQEIYKSGNDVCYITSDGSCYKFIRNGDIYACEDTKDINLAVTEDGYTVTDKNLTEYRFNPAGQLISITETNGYNIHNYYDQYARLTKVTSKQSMNGSRTLVFDYSDTDMFQLESIALPDGTAMEYTAVDGELTKVSHTNGTLHTDYCYDYNNGIVTEIRDAEDNAYGFTYADGKVDTISYPDSTYDEFEYSSGSADRSYKTSSGTVIFEEAFTTDNNARVTARTGRDGLSTAITYSASEPYLPGSEQYTAAYESIDPNGNVVFHEDSTAETTYTYNADGNITSEEGDASVTTYAYGDSNNSSLVTEERTQENGETTEHTTYAYDSDGNVVEEEDLIDDIITEASYSDGNASSETVTENGVTTSETEYDYDAEGNIISEETAAGIVEENMFTTYDDMGRVISESDGKTVTSYTYDYMGRVIATSSVTQGIDGTRTTSSSYDGNGTLISETDERGAVTTYTYDSMNRLLTASKEGDTTTRSYTYTGSITIDGIAMSRTYDVLTKETVTDTFGNVVSETYTDPSGHVVREIVDGVTQDHIYDKSGNQVATKTAAEGMEPQISLSLYDRNGRATHEIIMPTISGDSYVIGSETIVSETTYSDKGEVTETKSGEGNQLYYSYDESGRITGIGESAEANDRTVTYSFDGLTTTIHDAGGKIQTEVQDGSGLTLSITDSADGCTSMQESYTYDSDGYLTKKILPDGSEIRYTNDPLGRITVEKRYEYDGEGLTQTSEIHYSYNLYGDITGTECYTVNGGSQSPYYSTAITYDDLGRKTSETVTNGSDAAQTTTWTYDAKGRVTDIDYPALSDIDSVSYTYDQYDRLTAISTGSATYDRTVTYDSYGRPAVVTDKCGQAETITTYSYDAAGRVTGIRHSRDNNDLLSYTYAYDKDNRITSRHEVNIISGAERDETRGYSYGSYSRLTQTSVSRTIDGNTVNSQYSYTYDAAGNRISAAEPDKTTTYTFNGLDQLVSASDGTVSTAYAYDDNGNLISESSSDGGRTDYDFSPEGTLRSVSIQNGTDSYTEQMLYDADGIRIEKTIGDVSEHYYYVDGLMVLGKKNSGNSLTYLYAGSEVIGSVSGNNRYDYLQDIQESTAAILSTSGASASVYDYTDFGETSEIVADNTGNEICYTGAVYDKETGEYYLNARYYDPETAQFLSQDTYRGDVKDILQWNLYAYCGSIPNCYTDPSGNKAKNISKVLDKTMLKNARWLFKYSKKIRNKYGLAAALTGAMIIKYAGSIKILNAFIKKVRNGGEWDLKLKKKWQPKTYGVKKFKYHKYSIEAQDVGNIHFGYVGAVLFGKITLCSGAGFYQILSGTSSWNYVKSYFDDPRDTKYIKIGYAMWKKKYGKRVYSW